MDLWTLRHGLEEEVAQPKIAEVRLERMAIHDPLVNLPNRHGLLEVSIA